MVLRDAGVVNAKRNGKQIHYSLSNKNFIKASDLIRQILIEKHKDDELADEFTIKMRELVPLTHDPVCDMRVSPKTASFAKKYKGKEYYFCASGCFEKFRKNPDKFAN